VEYLWRSGDSIPPLTGILRVGDQLLEVAGQDLRGASAVRFMAAAYSYGRSAASVPLTVQRDGGAFETTIELVTLPIGWWGTTPFAVGIAITGLLLMLRAHGWVLRRRFFVASLLFSIGTMFFRSLGGAVTFAWALGVEAVALPVAAALTLWNAFEWTEASRPARRWQRALALTCGFVLAGIASWMNFLAAPPWLVLVELYTAAVVLFMLILLLAAASNVTSASPLERRQGKWILLGLAFGTGPLVGAFVWGLLGLPLDWELGLLFVGRLALLALPVGIWISVIAYQFLDIDRLIGASVSYTLLGVMLLGGAFVLVPRVSASAGAAFGLDPGTSQIVLSMVLAAVAVPLYRTVRPWVDRVLLAERFAVDRGFEALLRELPAARDAGELVQLAGEALTTLLRPESCVVYSRSGDAFEPLFVRGRAVPPAFESKSPLVGALAERTTPLVARRFAQRDLREKLSPFDRAALETLAMAAVVPVRRRGELVAFLALGQKRSGDIYSPADLTLLSAVSGTVSSRLERFDDAEVAREARALQQELRRYVPGAVARVIESAQSLEPREQAVSVLFVDIRGYAAYAETRTAHEIFSTVNRYTTTVSGIVEKNGGAVVEFNGDGMMAVFGAPLPLPTKEQAAVAAAREIIETLGTADSGDEPALSVGVGIATGSAYVGAVEAVDRMIWTALGNTTNLAARLQGLTRELDASIVIDAATHRSAGETAAGFEPRAQVPIRGRTQREDVYLLRQTKD
jgi:class 3 adenylate cyclase